jgi:hypothetical protein
MEYWENIVLLRPDRSEARALAVKNSKDAARVLLKAWPNSEGRSYRRAVLNCSAAIHGKVPQDLAQWSFIVAAMEAAISYEIVDRFDAEIAAVCRELIDENAPAQWTEASDFEEKAAMPPFWWPKRPASVPSAQ